MSPSSQHYFMRFIFGDKTSKTMARWVSAAGARRIASLVFSLALLGFFILEGCAPAPVHDQAPIDLNAAVIRAKADHKLVLLDFTGSDWCPPCMRLHKEIFSKPEFEAYAATNLIFLTVDFPRKFQLTPDARSTNDVLAAKFNIEGYPTLVALDGEGKEIWRQLGSLDGGLKELAADIASAKAKAP